MLGHRGHGEVDHQGDLEPDRPQEAHRRADDALDRRGVGRDDRRRPERPGDLRRVGLVVPAQERGDGTGVGEVDQELAGGRLVDLEEVADLVDRAAVGGRDGLDRRVPSSGTSGRLGAGADLGPLAVGRVAARLALDDHVLADRRRDHELVRAVAADRAALGLDDHVGDAAAVEDPAVGLVHRVVAGVELRHVGVEAVGVLHQELASPQDAEAGAGLVAELRLDLVEGDRQLLVRLDEVADQVGDDLLVRRPERHRLVAADGQLHQEVAVRLEPARLLPELDRLQGGHQQLERAGGVHLLADQPDDLAEHPEPQRQIRIGPRAELADHPRAEQ